jgi:hypothetical protein
MSRRPGQKPESWQASVQQLTETLVAVLTRCRHRVSEREWDVIEEALRRLAEHERLVRQVLPDLRNRLSAAEDGRASHSSTVGPCHA